MEDIYISEKNMPKSCDYCNYGKNCIPYKIEKVEEKDKTFSILETYNCPLQSIEQHDNEVRREFAEKVKSEFITDTCWCEMTFEQLDNLLKQYEVKE